MAVAIVFDIFASAEQLPSGEKYATITYEFTAESQLAFYYPGVPEPESYLITAFVREWMITGCFNAEGR